MASLGVSPLTTTPPDHRSVRQADGSARPPTPSAPATLMSAARGAAGTANDPRADAESDAGGEMEIDRATAVNTGTPGRSCGSPLWVAHWARSAPDAGNTWYSSGNHVWWSSHTVTRS